MSQLKIRIETDEYIYEEYIELEHQEAVGQRRG